MARRPRTLHIHIEPTTLSDGEVIDRLARATLILQRIAERSDLAVSRLPDSDGATQHPPSNHIPTDNSKP